MIYFVDDVGPSPLAQNVVLHDVGIICFGYLTVTQWFLPQMKGEFGVLSDIWENEKQHLLDQDTAHRMKEILF
ncbi:hypothetical protein D0Y65_004666 [Glycine soja]|uniref:Uncharacterized protein n=1 Tax=Glycine soja TaxID=3848 RepID=A0A445LS27_GLYSO|nr:hypothetical protein D0Y65_004666 [Glycine soja]